MSRLMLRERQPDVAVEQMQAAGVLLRAGAHPWVQHEAAAQQVRLDLAAGRAAEAAAALGEHGDYLKNGQVFPPLPADRAITYDEALLSTAALAVWARLAAEGGNEARLQLGVEAADALVDAAERAGLLPAALAAVLLRAELYGALGQAVPSRASVARAVALAEPAGAVEPFLEADAPAAAALAALLAEGALDAVEAAFARLVLDAFPAGAAAGPAADALLDPLTERELEILGLIADGLSNQQIADALYLSHHTVKKHVSNLFSKMAVSRRTQAVALARELGLL